MRKEYSTLARVYVDVRTKCGGRCSQYVGSTIGLANTRQMRSAASTLSRRILSGVRFADVFIPSFGAPHTFMHAGYER
jgi:hypothetical protein